MRACAAARTACIASQGAHLCLWYTYVSALTRIAHVGVVAALVTGLLAGAEAAVAACQAGRRAAAVAPSHAGPADRMAEAAAVHGRQQPDFCLLSVYNI